MCFDARHGTVVLFGGHDSRPETSDAPFLATWLFDGRWKAMELGVGPPAPRVGHAMAYDAGRGRVVLFGGTVLRAEGRHHAGDTWEWDGSGWSEAHPAERPSPRDGVSMVYDEGRRRCLLFGGSGPEGYCGDTWEWCGSRWHRCVTAEAPLGRDSYAMAYDAERQRVILVGGYRLRYLDDTWAWDGRSWTRLLPASGPRGRRCHALAREGHHGGLLLFGGQSPEYRGDMLAWDAGWVPLAVADGPTPRCRHGMAYDAERACVVLFGGVGTEGELEDTWELVSTLAVR